MSKKILILSANFDLYNAILRANGNDAYQAVDIRDDVALFEHLRVDPHLVAAIIFSLATNVEILKMANDYIQSSQLCLPMVAEIAGLDDDHAMLEQNISTFANAFIQLPLDHENVLDVLGQVENYKKEQLKLNGILDWCDGACDTVVKLQQSIIKAAKSDLPIVIEGAAGAPKTMVALSIARLSKRFRKPLCIVDCLTFGDELDQEVFGHSGHHGSIWKADKGIIFLNNISFLTKEFQQNLYRLLSAGEVYSHRLNTYIRLDVQVILTSEVDLIEEVKMGRLREDLYYRLNVSPIILSKLTSNSDDIPVLAQQFANVLSQKLYRHPAIITEAAIAALNNYCWPGGHLQFENVLKWAVVQSGGDAITIEHLSSLGIRRTHNNVPLTAPLVIEHTCNENEDFLTGSKQNEPFDEVIYSDQSFGLNETVSDSLAMLTEEGEIRPLDRVEEELIRYALVFYKGRMSHVAKQLGIGRSTLYRKLKAYEIDPICPLDLAS